MNLNEAAHLAGEAQAELQEAIDAAHSAEQKITDAQTKIAALVNAGYGNVEEALGATSIALSNAEELVSSCEGAVAKIGEAIG